MFYLLDKRVDTSSELRRFQQQQLNNKETDLCFVSFVTTQGLTRHKQYKEQVKLVFLSTNTTQGMLRTS